MAMALRDRRPVSDRNSLAALFRFDAAWARLLGCAVERSVAI